MKTLAFAPAALADLDEIWHYSVEKWGLTHAERYIDLIRDACLALASGQKQGRPAEVLPDFQKYLCGSHVIYFLADAEHLDVIRILHQRQDAGLRLQDD